MTAYLVRSGIGMWRGLALLALGAAQAPLAVLLLLILALQFVGAVFLFLPAVRMTRRWAGLARRVTPGLTGVDVAEPYRPKPPPPVRQPDGWYREGNQLYRTPRVPAFNRRVDWLLKDPATWRDFAWAICYPVSGALLAGLPAGMVLYGAARVTGWLPGSVPAGLLVAALGVLLAPWTPKLVGLSIAALLGPTERARLAGRVRSLARARTEVVDSQAAQLRGIERDLHDGAQARMVAVGMTLGAAERLIDTDPEAATALIGKAQEASSAALADLRRLVRGIRPPVLVERGLAEAVRALAVDSTLRVTVTARETARRDPAVESAVYFAVSELLTNAARHGGATTAGVEIAVSDDALTVTVTDDGSGGADPSGGSGLRGIERRLAAFDGSLALDSPPGGPTVARLRVPVSGPGSLAEPVRPDAPSRWKRVVAGLCLGLFAVPLAPAGVLLLLPPAVAAPPAPVVGGMLVVGLALLACGVRTMATIPKERTSP